MPIAALAPAPAGRHGLAMNLFVTGTGTGVGKTFVCRLMLRALAGLGTRAAAYKPVCCGGREDAVALRDAGCPGPSLDEVNPLWLQTPAAPLVGAQFENREIDPAALAAGLAAVARHAEHVLVEGAGGWEVPLAPGTSMADLAVRLGLPVLVVVDNRLGALNATILTVRAIQARGLPVAGLVLNHLEEERDVASVTNRSVLESWLDVPVLEDILHGETATDPAWVASLFGLSRPRD
jgi:dethiobiotin synthetase